MYGRKCKSLGNFGEIVLFLADHFFGAVNLNCNFRSYGLWVKPVILIDVISGSGYGVTVIDAKGYNNAKKYMLVIEVDNKSIPDIKEIIKKLDKHAFIVVTETKLVQNGYIK